MKLAFFIDGDDILSAIRSTENSLFKSVFYNVIFRLIFFSNLTEHLTVLHQERRAFDVSSPTLSSRPTLLWKLASQTRVTKAHPEVLIFQFRRAHLWMAGGLMEVSSSVEVT